MAVGPKEVVIKPAGVVTDPNPHSAAPAGAMRLASNCVLERDGLLEPRPMFTPVSGQLSLARAMIPFDDDILVTYISGTFWQGSGQRVDELDTFTNSPINVAWNNYRIRGAQARKNLYLTTRDGVRKLTSRTNTRAEFAGAPTPTYLVVLTSAVGAAVEPGNSVAYRAVTRRVDANGVEVTSQPTIRLVATNSSGGARNITVRLYLHRSARLGDTIDLYRSRGFLGTPDDELYLAGDTVVESGDLSNGYIDVVDVIPDNQLGRALYTNPSLGGILVANNRPPAANDIALFRGSLFFADVVGPQRIAISFPEVSVASAGEIGEHSTTGDYTNGSNVITNVASTAAARVGQTVYVGLDAAPGTFAGTANTPVVITAVTSNTITLSQNYTGTTAAAAPLVFSDSIRVGSVTVPAYNAAAFLRGMSGHADVYRRTLPHPDFVAYIADGDDVSGDSPRRTVVIEQRARGPLPDVSSSMVWASNGTLYSPPLPLPPDSPTSFTPAGLPMNEDIRRNGLVWSKQDQPEHVPEVNSVRVGSEREPILRIVPIRDALIIFKADGIWRLTGMGPDSGWRIDPLDIGTILLVPDTAQVLGQAVYAWTNRGVVRVTESDVTQVSTQYIGAELIEKERAAAPFVRDGSAGFAIAVEDRNSYILGLPENPTDAATERLWIWNTKTLAWTTWELEWRHGIWDPGATRIVGITSQGGEGGEGWEGSSALRVESPDDVPVQSVVDGVIIRVPVTEDELVYPAGIFGVSAVVGDRIEIGPESMTVVGVEVVEGDPIYIVDIDLAATFPSIDDVIENVEISVYRPITCAIEFVTKTAKQPGVGKHWRDGTWLFERLGGGSNPVAQYSDGNEGGITSQALTVPFTGEDTPPAALRSSVPRAHARSPHLFPRLTIRGLYWACSGVVLSYTPASSRNRR